MSNADRVLLADIGGTNARFALADPASAVPLLDDSVREFVVADFPSLADAAQHYLDETGATAQNGTRSARQAWLACSRMSRVMPNPCGSALRHSSVPSSSSR